VLYINGKQHEKHFYNQFSYLGKLAIWENTKGLIVEVVDFF